MDLGYIFEHANIRVVITDHIRARVGFIGGVYLDEKLL